MSLISLRRNRNYLWGTHPPKRNILAVADREKVSWTSIRTAHHSMVPLKVQVPIEHLDGLSGSGVSGEREARALRAPASRAAPLPAPRAYCPGEPAQLGKNPPGRYHPGAPRSQLKVSWHDEGRFTYTEGRRHDTAHTGKAEAALRPQPRPKLRRVRCLSRHLPPEQANHQPATRASEKKHPHQTDRRSIAAEGRNHRSQTKNVKGEY